MIAALTEGRFILFKNNNSAFEVLSKSSKLTVNDSKSSKQLIITDNFDSQLKWLFLLENLRFTVNSDLKIIEIVEGSRNNEKNYQYIAAPLTDAGSFDNIINILLKTGVEIVTVNVDEEEEDEEEEEEGAGEGEEKEEKENDKAVIDLAKNLNNVSISEELIFFLDDVLISIYDETSKKKKLQAARGSVKLLKTKYDYWIKIFDKKKELIVSVDFASNIEPVFIGSELEFHFNYNFGSTSTIHYVVKFNDPLDFKRFQNSVASFDKENNEKETHNTDTETKTDMQIKNKELFIALDTSDDDADDDEEEDNDDEEKEEEKEETANQSFSEDMGKNKIIRNFYEPHSKTDSLTVGFKLDRSYVVHRSNISILKNNEEDNELEYVTTISNISDIKDKKHFTPYKPMLYMEDRAMLFQNPSDQTAIYKMDIERGTIVEKWSMGNKALTSFGPAKKYDQLTNEQSFLGVSKKSLFQVDPRINSNNKIVLDATFDYKTNPKFTSLTTSQEGYVSVGSTDGSIRLYDKLGIRAKTLIPGFGDEIKHSVISNDGRWLLATCTDHLILYDLKIYEGKETTDLLAFSKSNSNPKYYYLKLPETIKTQIRSSGESNIIFSRGYFNYGRYAKEDTVVTSTGKFIIFWKLRNICKGIKEPVLLKKYDFDVIEDNFVYGSNNQVVVAFDKGVSMATSRKV